MAIYRVQGPDGAIHRFEGPDNASPQDVEAAAAQQFGNQSAQGGEQLSPMQRGIIGAGAGAKSAWDAASAGLARLAAHVTEPNPALKQLGYRSPISEGALAQAQQIEQQSAADRAQAAPVLNTTAGKVGDVLGTAGAALPTMLVPGANTYAGAALLGAGTGAAITPGGIEERAKGAGIGGIGGAVGQGIGNALSHVIAPVGTAATNALRNAGIELTPGQALGQFANKIEQKAQSLPLVGDLIANARRSGIEQFNVAATNEALAPLGVTVPKDVKAGRELMNFAAGKLDDAYAAVVPKLTATIDQRLGQDLRAGAQTAQQAGKQQQFIDIVRGKVLDKAQNGVLTGDALKQAESELKRAARGYASSPDPDQRALGQALQTARDDLMSAAARYSPPDAIKQLAQVDSAYARMVRVEGAAGMQGAKEGVFSPSQFMNQVRNQSGGPRKAQFARGNALMQDFGTAGESVLGNTVPDSGTTGRLLLNAGALAAGGGALPLLENHPLLAGGLLAAGGAYTPAGRRALNALIAPRTGPNVLALSQMASEQLPPYLNSLLVAGGNSPVAK